VNHFGSTSVSEARGVKPPKGLPKVSEYNFHGDGAPKLVTNNFIALGGRLRSGKDTVADYLVQKYGYVKIGMSDPLHWAMLQLDPIIKPDPEGDDLRYIDIIDQIGYTEAKAQYPEVRRLLQQLGTEVGRNMLGENVWVDAAARSINGYLNEGKRVVLTGIRFPNELGLAQRFNGRTWWVSRPSAEDTPGAHASENGVRQEDFELVVGNTADVEYLYGEVDRALSLV